MQLSVVFYHTSLAALVRSYLKTFPYIEETLNRKNCKRSKLKIEKFLNTKDANTISRPRGVAHQKRNLQQLFYLQMMVAIHYATMKVQL